MKRRINPWDVLGTLLFFGLMVIGFLPKPLAEAADALKTSNQHLLATYAKLPLSFEANLGQTNNQVKFLSRGSGYTLFLTHRGEAVLALRKPAPEPKDDPLKPAALLSTLAARKRDAAGASAGISAGKSAVVRIKLVGGNAKPRAEGLDELPGKANYFIGNDPKKWRTNVSTYAKLKYERVYPGVDLVYYGNQGQLEYDFVVAPGVDPNEIRLKFCGAEKLGVDEKGDLLLGSGSEEVRLEKPVVYQEVGGARKPVEGRYVLASANRIGFQLGEYDHSQPVVIDPVLVYSTYLGGSNGDQVYAIAVDSAGNAYVTGSTTSSDFPTVNALQPTKGLDADVAFVSKFNLSGSALIYSTYLGGNTGVGGDTAFAFGDGIAVDSAGNAHVTGVTKETDFPTVNPLQPAYGGGFYSAFVFKLNPSGSALVYSTYWGGSADSFAYAIAVDSADNAYVTGHAEYESFPTTPGAFQTAYGGRGSENAFVSKFNPSGSALVYSTLLGGSDFDVAYGIAVDASGNAYVTGNAGSPDFPTTAGAFQTTRGTFGNAFITKINTTGAALVYSTYLGGNGGDVGFGIAVDSAGNAYVTGTTTSTDFPTVNPLQPTYGGGGDAFVSKFNPSGSALVYSTYLGGSAGDTPRGIAVDGFGNAYLTGDTGSTNFPTTAGTFQTTYGGQGDAFVAKIANGGSAQGGSVQGGGTINVSGGLANFGFNVQQQTNDGSVDGNLQYENHASGAKVHSVTFTGFTIDGNTAAFSGTCTNNGAPCTFNLTVRGNDQPQGSDSFIISINGGPPEGGTLKGGNINIRQ